MSNTYPIHKGYADTNYGQVHFRSTGSPSAPALVLLHQTASSGAMFEPLMRLLSDEFFIIAPDTPGFGGSFAPPPGFSVKFLADCLHAALTNIGVESCFVFGHHTGAALGVQLSHDHPGFVRRLALSGPPLLSPEQVAGLKAALRVPALDPDGAHLAQIWERIRKRDESLPLEVVQREVLLTQQARLYAPDAYQAVFDQPFGEQLAGLDIPVLVMAGEHDTLRASLEPAFALLKNGQMQVLAGQGPYVCDQAPQALATVLHDFLR